VPDPVEITLFICANCARPGKMLTSASRTPPAVPDLQLTNRVQQVIVPCTGRLQPEHILRAFEAGSKIVSVVACQEDNCHYAEGSRRCALRVEYVQSILQEIGLGAERLLLSYLPGSASGDLALAAGKPADSESADSESADSESGELLNVKLADLRSQVIKAFHAVPPNPLRLSSDMLQEKYEDLSDLSEDDSDE